MVTREFRSYRMQVVPWLWLLSHSADCRIFQDKNVPDILEEVFQDHGFRDYEFRVTRGDYPPLVFCVQYRETALAFVSRLMEREGLFYFFEHEEKRHVMVIADRNIAFNPLPEESIIVSDAGGQATGCVTRWEHAWALRTGRHALRHYDFENPSVDLLTDEATVVDVEKAKSLERFDYPGHYTELDRGRQLARVQMQAEEAGYHLVHGVSDYAQFRAGGRFLVGRHTIPGEADQAYVLRSVRHEAHQAGYFNDDGITAYANSFEAFPKDTPFRPAFRTARPIVQGPQTAVVVGPPGEEILTDKYGRVKVQFHWDRQGTRDENSSCWVRVSQSWAGSGYGFIQIPRIGQEVIVDFLEGDPDQPIITGRVYNAMQMPPHALPGGMVKSGLKSNSTKGGGGSNEFTFDDTKGKEKVYLHAQYDMTSEIEHDDSQHVINNRTIKVDGTHTETIKKDTTITITEGNVVYKVDTGTSATTVKGKVTETYQDSQDTTVTNGIKITSTSAFIHVKASTEIVLEVGASKIALYSDGRIEVKGKSIAINGSDAVNISGMSIKEEAGNDHSISGAIVKSSGTVSNTVRGAMVMLNP
ncbi:type VI secretion system tip protein VgrG [Leptolyngbya sp. 15MV]|nr:type VI secretion system tip protein VgrG [Leptolyngbya sp. 15MV]